MNKLPGIVSTLALTLLGVSCSHEQAGVISETTNGATLSGTIISPDGTPRPDAFVELRSIESCSGCTVNEITTVVSNSRGSYTFNNIEPGSYVVYSAPAPESAMGLNVVVPGNVQELDLPEAMVSTTDSLAGTVKLPGEAYPVTIALLGTGFTATTDLNGSFTIRNLPRIDLLCRVHSTRDGQSPAIVPSAVFRQSDTVVLDTGVRVLLDNFDDAYGPHLLTPFIGSGNWYTRASAAMYVTPASALIDVATTFTTEGAFRKQSLSIAMTTTATGGKEDLFIIGLEIGRGYTGSGPHTWFDLSAMSALSFAARGAGTVRVLLLSKLIKDNYSGADHFEKTIKLSEAWQQFRITPAELAPPEESDAKADGVTWQEASRSIAEITFISAQSVTIGLDDISIEGVSIIELMASGNR